MERIDEGKLDVLRRWAEGLSGDARDEVRAAGRAIVLLVEEIERLHVDLWHARQQAAAPPPAQAPPAADSGLDKDLRSRLAGRLQWRRSVKPRG